jgi:hypothetical protein
MNWWRDAPEGHVSVVIGLVLVALGCVVSLYDQDWRWLATTAGISLALAAWTYAIAWMYHRWFRPRPAWQCRGCGYDLRGLAQSTPCPECGRRG